MQELDKMKTDLSEKEKQHQKNCDDEVEALKEEQANKLQKMLIQIENMMRNVPEAIEEKVDE